MFERGGRPRHHRCPAAYTLRLYITLGPVWEVISGENSHFTHRRKMSPMSVWSAMLKLGSC
jgi:hypothetical protein